jgi:hypothetical protein
MTHARVHASTVHTRSLPARGRCELRLICTREMRAPPDLHAGDASSASPLIRTRSPQVSRLAAPLAQEIDRLSAAGAFFPPAVAAATAGGGGAAERREAVLRALDAAAGLAAPSAGYACEALGAAALVSGCACERWGVCGGVPTQRDRALCFVLFSNA